MKERMMPYDFETLPERRGTGASKWEAMLSDNPDLADDVVPLSVADMEFATPEPIKNALHRLIDETTLGYTEPTDAFYDSCIAWQERRHGWKPERDWIVTSPGVVPALFTAVRAFTDEGDGVIIQPPVYYPFSMAIERTGRTILRNPLIEVDGSYRIDFDSLDRIAHSPEAKAIIICSPHNPVGRVWSEEELLRMVEICSDAGLVILCDEIHNDLILPGHVHHTLLKLATPEQARRIAVFTSYSKTFSLAGTLGSVIYIPDESLRKRFEDQHASEGFFGLNAFAFRSLIAAYDECEGWLDALIPVIDRNYRLLVDTLDGKLGGLRVIPLEGTYLPWVDFSAWGMDADDREMFLHKEAQLYLDGGAMFGEEGASFERFNIACPTWVLEDALERLSAAYERLHDARKEIVQ